MSTKQQAVNEIRDFAKRFKGILALADDLEKIGSIDNATKEAEERLATAQSRESQASAELAIAFKDLDKVKAQASQIMADARKMADQMVDVGKKAGAQIVEDGKHEAGRLVDGALLRHKDIEKETKRLEGYVAHLVKEIDEKQAIVADLDKKIEAIRAKIS